MRSVSTNFQGLQTSSGTAALGRTISGHQWRQRFFVSLTPRTVGGRPSSVCETISRIENTRKLSLAVLLKAFSFKYTPAFAPIVLNKALAWNGGHNVADFRVYSAAALGEMLVFLDDIGRALAAHLKIVVESLTPSMRAGDFTYLIEPLERLLKRLGAAQ